MDLKNKVAVITGGAVGIGYEIADNYLENGAKVVVLVDINQQEGEESSKNLNAKHGAGKAVFYKGDVTNENDLNTIFKNVTDSYKYVDILVNNAGILNDVTWKKCIDINVTYLIGWTKKYWEHMREDKGGKGGAIVNLCSVYGFRVDPYLPVYQASKFAVMGFTKSLGHEYNYNNYGVRVVAICPGFTETNLTKEENIRTWEDPKRSADFKKFAQTCSWQKVGIVGRAAVEVLGKESGTAWIVEDNKPIIQVP